MEMEMEMEMGRGATLVLFWLDSVIPVGGTRQWLPHLLHETYGRVEGIRSLDGFRWLNEEGAYPLTSMQ